MWDHMQLTWTVFDTGIACLEAGGLAYEHGRGVLQKVEIPEGVTNGTNRELSTPEVFSPILYTWSQPHRII